MYAANQTLTNGQTFTTDSAAIATNGADSVDLYLKATGANASSAGIVQFYVVASYDGIAYESVGSPLVLTLAANAAVVANAIKLDTRNVRYLKVDKIVNGDATYGLTGVNVHAFALQ
jgi:hypothetical protein